jgi:hypothetical protein
MQNEAERETLHALMHVLRSSSESATPESGHRAQANPMPDQVLDRSHDKTGAPRAGPGY